MNARPFGRFHGFGHRVDIGLDAARQGRDDRSSNLFGNGSDRREITRRRGREPRFNYVDAETRQLVGDLEFLGAIQAAPRRLLTVSQRGIENIDFSHQ